MNSLTQIWTSLPQEPERARAARELLDAASAVDGIDALSEQFVLGLDDARLEHSHLIGEDENGKLVAVAAIAGDEAEFAVHPEQRRKGYGAQVYSALSDKVKGLKVWAHGNGEGAQAIAASESLSVVRRLLVLEISGEALQQAAAGAMPENFTALNLADSISRWGEEEVLRAWLAANNEAFSWHPEQGGWDLERLRRGMEVDWFSAEDVWLLWDTPDATDEQLPGLAGFHWTKWHDSATAEVYVVGLASDYRGRGLGQPAVTMGLRHLSEGGAQRVILYVEDDNAAAVERYRQDGFTIAEEHVVYSWQESAES